MKIVARHAKLVNTDCLHRYASDWLTLDVPDALPEPSLKLIASHLQILCAAWTPHSKTHFVLEASQFGNLLVLRHHVSSNTDAQSSEVLLALNRIAWQVSELSAICNTEQQTSESDQPENEDSTVAAHPLASEASDQRSLFTPHAESTAEGVQDFGDEPSALPSNLRAIDVFTWPGVNTDGGLERGRDEDSAKRMGRTLKRLRSSGSMRPLRGPVHGWQQKLATLANDFPNFAKLITTVIRPHLALISKGYQHRMPSVLLVGPPGIGKTYFTQTLAGILDTGPALFVPMAEATNNSTLAGSSTFWSNASPGALFERLAWGSGNQPAVANPLVILDEVDKVKGDRYDPLGPLYTLLETETARSWQDQAVPDVYIDASHIRVMATANDESFIPEPLLSRVLVFQIAAPDHAQSRRVVQRIYEGLIRSIGLPMRSTLPGDVMESAMAISPREAKVRLSCAMAMADADGRDHVNLQDWQEANLGTVQKKTIGFNA